MLPVMLLSQHLVSCLLLCGEFRNSVAKVLYIHDVFSQNAFLIFLPTWSYGPFQVRLVSQNCHNRLLLNEITKKHFTKAPLRSQVS